MSIDLKQPLTLNKLFGILEPEYNKPLNIVHTQSIKNILYCLPIEYDEDLLELSWDIGTCCRGWFLKKDKDETYGRVHGGCDGKCFKELPDKASEYMLNLRIPDYPRKNTDPLEFMLSENTNIWICKIIPAIKSNELLIPAMLSISIV